MNNTVSLVYFGFKCFFTLTISSFVVFVINRQIGLEMILASFTISFWILLGMCLSLWFMSAKCEKKEKRLFRLLGLTGVSIMLSMIILLSKILS